MEAEDGCIQSTHFHSQSVCFRDQSTTTEVVSRNFETTLFSDKTVLNTIQSELNDLLSIDHPNLVPFNELINDPPFIRLKRRFVHGTSLSKIVCSNGHLDKRTGLKIGFKVLQAVSYLHTKNIVLKALKPENVIITPQMEPMIIDFGISAILDDTIKRPDTISSLIYLGPERIEDPKSPPTQKLDIFHFGLFFYLIFIGKFPWRVVNMARIMKDLNSKTIPFPPEFDKDLKSIIYHCMDPNPEQRPSADKLINVIHKILMKKEVNCTSQTQLPIHQSASLRSMGKCIAMARSSNIQTLNTQESIMTTCPLPPKSNQLPITRSYFVPTPSVKTLPLRTRQISKTESQSSFTDLHSDGDRS